MNIKTLATVSTLGCGVLSIALAGTYWKFVKKDFEAMGWESKAQAYEDLFKDAEKERGELMDFVLESEVFTEFLKWKEKKGAH